MNDDYRRRAKKIGTEDIRRPMHTDQQSCRPDQDHGECEERHEWHEHTSTET